MVSFDFSGSGMSEGDWVTLGYFEQHDVADVLAYLRSNGKIHESGKYTPSSTICEYNAFIPLPPSPPNLLNDRVDLQWYNTNL